MMVNTCSAAIMALFIGVLCALSCCSIESRAMTTGEVTSSAPAVTTGAAHAGMENDSLTALRKLRRSRQSPSQKRTAVISGKRLATVTTAAVLLTAVVGMLMASGKLRQCLHAMMNQTGGEIEGNKKRRLAEGNDESDKCAQGPLHEAVSALKAAVSALKRTVDRPPRAGETPETLRVPLKMTTQQLKTATAGIEQVVDGAETATAGIEQTLQTLQRVADGLEETPEELKTAIEATENAAQSLLHAIEQMTRAAQALSVEAPELPPKKGPPPVTRADLLLSLVRGTELPRVEAGPAIAPKAEGLVDLVRGQDPIWRDIENPIATFGAGLMGLVRPEVAERLMGQSQKDQ